MKEETISAALQEKLSNLKKLNDAIDLFRQLENEAVLKSLVEQKRNLAKDISQDYFKIMILSGLEEDIVQCVKNYSLFEDSAIQFSLLLKVSKNNVKVEIQNVNLPVDDVNLLDKMMDSYQKNSRNEIQTVMRNKQDSSAFEKNKVRTYNYQSSDCERYSRQRSLNRISMSSIALIENLELISIGKFGLSVIERGITIPVYAHDRLFNAIKHDMEPGDNLDINVRYGDFIYSAKLVYQRYNTRQPQKTIQVRYANSQLVKKLQADFPEAYQYFLDVKQDKMNLHGFSIPEDVNKSVKLFKTKIKNRLLLVIE